VTRAKGGQSNHNYGLAVDLCPFVNGKPDWNAPLEVWAKLGKEADKLDLVWGGNWKKFLDKPHVQLSTLTIAQCQALYRKGGLPLVWERASKSLKLL
jgi:peptidoglycan L-alanyl-D-glutamate endopeptidase CwlK